MWIYLSGGSAAINMDHVTRLYVEETGSGAALKADIDNKTTMVGYFESKQEALDALKNIMEKREAHAPVVRL
ncbi:MAG: hypothetical protein OHK0029_31830 [Armatimonadaceae bacterium]